MTRGPNLCLACVIADLHGICHDFPISIQASDRPSSKFFSTSRIEPLDHKLMAMTPKTINWAGNARLRSSCAWVVAMRQGGLPVRARFLNCRCWYSGFYRLKDLFCL